MPTGQHALKWFCFQIEPNLFLYILHVIIVMQLYFLGQTHHGILEWDKTKSIAQCGIGKDSTVSRGALTACSAGGIQALEAEQTGKEIEETILWKSGISK